MKTAYFLGILSVGFLIYPSLGLPPPPASDDDPEFAEARQLFWSGQYDEAEKKFKLYLVDHPDNEASCSFLQMINQERKHDPSKIDLTKKRLETIMVGKITFQDTEWHDVSARLQELANPKVNGKEPDPYINFINMLSSGTTFKVSLDLRNISLLKLIELSCRQAGLRYVVDTWAVIVDLPENKK